MAQTTERIVTVWLDTTSDDHGWIVDTDTAGGGESETICVFPPDATGRKWAIAFGEHAAFCRGVRLEIK